MKTTKTVPLLFLALLFLTFVVSMQNAYASTTFSTPSPLAASRVAKIGNWVNVDLLYFTPSGGSRQTLSATESTHIISSLDCPTVHVLMSPIGNLKSQEEMIGQFPTSDGRTIFLKKFTYAFDVAVYTVEEWTSPIYFGAVGTATTYTEDLVKFLVYDLEDDALTLDVLGEGDPENVGTIVDNLRQMERNPQLYLNDTPIISSSKINFQGYNIDEDKFLQIKDRKMTGALDVSVTVDPGVWSQTFGDVLTPYGNFSFDDVYVQLLGITCQQSRKGLLGEATPYKVIADAISYGDSLSPGDVPTENEPQSVTPTLQSATYSSKKEEGVSTATFACNGHYVTGHLQTARESPEMVIAPVVGQEMVMWVESDGYREDLIVEDTTDYAKDPTQDQASFTALYSLKPALSYQTVKHEYVYNEKQIEARIWTETVHPLIGFPKFYWGKDWVDSGISGPETRYKTVTVAAGVQNVYAISTYYVDILVGAFYDWSPLVENEYVSIAGIDLGNGEEIFLEVWDGTGEAEKTMTLTTFVNNAFRAFTNPATAILPLEMAGLSILGLWLFYIWKAYNKSHPKVKEVKVQQPQAPHPLRQRQPWAMMGSMFGGKGGGTSTVQSTGFFDMLTDGLGKKIITTIVLFIVLLIIFSILL